MCFNFECDIVFIREVNNVKKNLKTLVICLSVIVVLAVAMVSFLFLSSPKFIIKNDTIVRAYIYHNELEREIYELDSDETARLCDAVSEIKIGKSVGADEYEPVTGGPWFSIFCEMKCGKTIQLYASGQYLHINSVPFKTEGEGFKSIIDLHKQVEEKILPIDPSLLEEILNKRES